MRKTTISKKPHQKTTFVVFLTGEENHNVVFWMEQKNHIVVIRPHDRRVQSTTFVRISKLKSYKVFYRNVTLPQPLRPVSIKFGAAALRF
jgi:hypothetical protein